MKPFATPSAYDRKLVCRRCRACLDGWTHCERCAMEDASFARDSQARRELIATLVACAREGRLRNDSIRDCAHGLPLVAPCVACTTLTDVLASLREPASPEELIAGRREDCTGNFHSKGCDGILLGMVALLSRLEERRALVGEGLRLRGTLQSVLRRTR